MSVKSKIGMVADVATLVGASAITVGGLISAYKMIKSKKEWYMVAAAAVVILVGVSASKYSIESIKASKSE